MERKTYHAETATVETLRTVLSPEMLSQTLAHFLRVPEAWRQLQVSTLLERIIANNASTAITPSQIALAVCGEMGAEYPTATLPDSVEARIHDLMQSAEQDVSEEKDFEAVALMAFAIAQQCESEVGVEGIANLALAHPHIWKSPLACSWLWLQDPKTLLTVLLENCTPRGIALSANLLLANVSASAAANLISEIAPSTCQHIPLVLNNLGEHALADRMSAIITQQPDNPVSTKITSGPAVLLAGAVQNLARGDYEKARQQLDNAWEASSKTSALIADHIAETARLEGDSILEIEARKQALRSHPSSLRRASLALTLVYNQKVEEALSSVDQEPSCIEEQIATGVALAHGGEINAATELLVPAANDSLTMVDVDDRWLKALAQGLRKVGKFENALQVIKLHADRSPAQFAARSEYIQMLQGLGDHAAAAEQASLLYTLHPQSHEARRLLAVNLQKSGDHQASISHWKALAQDDLDCLWDLAECALQADEASTAEEAAINLLQNDPDALRAKVILGKAHAAQGRLESAFGHFKNTIEVNPRFVDGWIALSECQNALGDPEAADDTLSEALRHAPEDTRLQVALAHHLKRQNRLDESMQCLRKAVEHEPSNVNWLMAYGEVLNTLGRVEDARSVLERAHSHQPYNWRVAFALGKVYETRQDDQRAAQLLRHLPQNAPPDAHYLAGRMLAKSQDGFEKRDGEKAVHHLQVAKDSGVIDPAWDYWMGRAQERNDQHELAFQHYQASLNALKDGDRETYKQALQGTARSALATDRIPIALTTLETAQENFPASTDILRQLSDSYLLAELPEQAMHVAQKAVEIDPADHDALTTLSKSAVALGDWPQAIQATKRILANHPQDRDAWMKLAEYTHKAGRPIEARNAVAQAIWMDRQDPEILLSTAKILVQIDEPAYAQRNIKQAIDLAPQDIEVHEELARISQKLGDFESEQAAWLRMLELDPGNLNALTQGAQALWNLDRRALAIGLWQQANELDEEDVEINLKLGRAYIADGEKQRGLQHLLHAYNVAPASAELAKETGAALLRFGSPLDALEVLQRAIHLSPEDSSSAADLGECLMKLERYDEAKQALKRAKSLSTHPHRVEAMLARIAFSEGDLAAAYELIHEASQGLTPSVEDTLNIAETALRMGRWNLALGALETSLSDGDNLETLMALAELRLRLGDAHWLYAVAGSVENHAPDANFTGQEGQREFSALLDRCVRAGASQRAVDKLNTWAAYTFGENSMQDLEAEVAFEPTGVWGSIIHAQAISLYKMGDAAKAAEIIQASPAFLEPDAWGAIILGLCYTSMEKATQALHAYDTAARNAIVQPLADYLASETLWKAGAVDDSLTKINTALSTWPDEATWHATLASRYQEIHRFDAAVAHLQQAIELKPDHPDCLQALAQALRRAGQFSESFTSYEQLLKIAPERKTAWKEAAQVAMANGKAKIAQTWFERAATLSPSDPACLIGAARAATSQGESQQALAHIEAAARMAPDDLDVLVGMGEILAKQGRFEKALRAYEQAIKRSNGQLDVHIGRSKLLLQIGRPDRAIQDLQALLEDHSENEELWGALSEAYETTGDLENAIEAAMRATQLSPRNPKYRYQVGRISRLAGQLDRALDELIQAQSTAPTDAKVSRELGLVYEQRRELARALEAYRRSLQLDPQDELSHYRAGLILKQQKAYPQAARLLERAVELNPKDSEVIQQLAAVRALELVHGGL